MMKFSNVFDLESRKRFGVGILGFVVALAFCVSLVWAEEAALTEGANQEGLSASCTNWINCNPWSPNFTGTCCRICEDQAGYRNWDCEVFSSNEHFDMGDGLKEYASNNNVMQQINEVRSIIDNANEAITQLQEKLELERILGKKESESKNVEHTKVEKEDSNLADQQITFKVQICSSSVSLAQDEKKFEGVENVWEYREGGLYKYTVGSNKDLGSASALRRELCRKGFQDAFVVSFQNGKRIPVRVAKKLLK